MIIACRKKSCIVILHLIFEHLKRLEILHGVNLLKTSCISTGIVLEETKRGIAGRVTYKMQSIRGEENALVRPEFD